MSDISEKEFDVIGFAKKIMREIDGIRSYSKETDEKTKQGFQLPTETRINAFLRLIGMPYFLSISDKDDSSKKGETLVLNPGFGKTVRRKFADKHIENNLKLNYSYKGTKSDRLATILTQRESFLIQQENGTGKEDISSSMEKAICAPLDIKPNIPENKRYRGTFTPGTNNKSGNNKTNEQSTTNNNAREVYKKLFPLIPYFPEESQKVLPLNREIARPFTLQERERRISSEIVARKPFLEEVIRIRFVEMSNKTKSEKQTEDDIQDSIKDLIGEEEYSAIFGEGDYFQAVSVVEQFIINKFIDAIRNMARKWVNLNNQRTKLLRKIKPSIVIKTSSSQSSPFGKRLERSIELTGTAEGEKIKKLNRAIAKEEALLALLPTDESEKTEVNQQTKRNISHSALQPSLLDMLNYNLTKNRELKKSLLSNAKKNIASLEKIRLEMELMTGEFTGLSMPDVVCTIAALFIMEKNYLLDLLDKYAIDFMATDPNLKSIVENVSPTQENTMAAVKKLEKTVNALFALFQNEVEVKQDRDKKGKNRVSPRVESDDQNSKIPPCTASSTTEE
jgi:hypothetical protein